MKILNSINKNYLKGILFSSFFYYYQKNNFSLNEDNLQALVS